MGLRITVTAGDQEGTLREAIRGDGGSESVLELQKELLRANRIFFALVEACKQAEEEIESIEEQLAQVKKDLVSG